MLNQVQVPAMMVLIIKIIIHVRTVQVIMEIDKDCMVIDTYMKLLDLFLISH